MKVDKSRAIREQTQLNYSNDRLHVAINGDRSFINENFTGE